MSSGIKKASKILGAAILATAIVIQFVPVARANPPVTGDLVAPENVKQVLQTSCYDCHSNATKWPWYSYLAPVSWLVAHDVKEGREHLNFSEWEPMGQAAKVDTGEEILEEMSEGNMPIPIYLITHPSARITSDEFAVVRAWLASVGVNSEAAGHEEGERE